MPPSTSGRDEGRLVDKGIRRQMPAGSKSIGLGVRFASEAHSHQSLQSIRVALEVLCRHPMGVEILAAEVDKRDRAPEQVDGSVRQRLFVAGLGFIFFCFVFYFA